MLSEQRWCIRVSLEFTTRKTSANFISLYLILYSLVETHMHIRFKRKDHPRDFMVSYLPRSLFDSRTPSQYHCLLYFTYYRHGKWNATTSGWYFEAHIKRHKRARYNNDTDYEYNNDCGCAPVNTRGSKGVKHARTPRSDIVGTKTSRLALCSKR